VARDEWLVASALAPLGSPVGARETRSNLPKSSRLKVQSSKFKVQSRNQSNRGFWIRIGSRGRSSWPGAGVVSTRSGPVKPSQTWGAWIRITIGIRSSCPKVEPISVRSNPVKPDGAMNESPKGPSGAKTGTQRTQGTTGTNGANEASPTESNQIKPNQTKSSLRWRGVADNTIAAKRRTKRISYCGCVACVIFDGYSVEFSTIKGDQAESNQIKPNQTGSNLWGVGRGGQGWLMEGGLRRWKTSSPRPSPPQVCGGEGEDAEHFPSLASREFVAEIGLASSENRRRKTGRSKPVKLGDLGL
jgi:hypothetical protein